MPALSAYEYAAIRVVPQVERGEFVNVGMILLCRQRRFLAARCSLNEARLLALSPTLDLAPLAEQLDHLPLICAGGRAAGPIGELPLYERFRWLVAPRNTVIQPSPVYTGLCEDPAATLERLYRLLVDER